MDRVIPVPDFTLPKHLGIELGACKNGAYFKVPLFIHDNVKIEIYGEGFSSETKAQEYASQVLDTLRGQHD